MLCNLLREEHFEDRLIADHEPVIPDGDRRCHRCRLLDHEHFEEDLAIDHEPVIADGDRRCTAPRSGSRR